MVVVKKEGIILEKSSNEFENEGVLNPAVIRVGDSVHIFYRAVSNGNYSSIGYCRLDGPLTLAERWDRPIMVSEFDYEAHGVEDARIVSIENTYYMTYTAYDGINARGALATSKDLKNFTKKGIIVPPITYSEFVDIAENDGDINIKYYRNHKFYYQEADPEKKMLLWDKNLIFFPRKIDGKFVFLHRIRPGIQLVRVKSLDELTLDFWRDYFHHFHKSIVLDPVYSHEYSYVGGGCPPIETEVGWLLIYHGVEKTPRGLVYSACAALLDIDNPTKVISRLPYALFSPEYDWEVIGEVNNVVFPTGTALFGDTLFIYYGAADEQIACASLNLPSLLKELVENNDEADKSKGKTPEILVLTSYPPRVCGIATYSQDLITAVTGKFGSSFSIKICALETPSEKHSYPDEVDYILNTSEYRDYQKLTDFINNNDLIKGVLIQHEFGLFDNENDLFGKFLLTLQKPVILVFHTVIPTPDSFLRVKVKNIIDAVGAIIVMTNNSAKILINEYDAIKSKISVIPHGTHLVFHSDRDFLKNKYKLKGKKVLTTFGLLSSGKSIETTLDALPAIIKKYPEVVFVVIGKTHPTIIKSEGERYREMLEAKVSALKIGKHVRFINSFMALEELLEYLQLTDIYLFTTKNPFQAVSGTFAYAMSCACPIISTPIPHATEVMNRDTGIIIDFGSSVQLAQGVIHLLGDEPLRLSMSSNALQKIVSTSWENSAIAHAELFKKIIQDKIPLKYNLPKVNIGYIKEMTTDTGIIQFAKINQPDIGSGYTLDDNARALIALCMHSKLTSDPQETDLIKTYLNFIDLCQQPNGNFLNYVDQQGNFTEQNNVNLDDANGRAVWALGYFISLSSILPEKLVSKAIKIIKRAIPHIKDIYSSRAMAFAIKGLYYYNLHSSTKGNIKLIKTFADRLLEMFKHESSKDWMWFEDYLTYANSSLPESMLYAWLATKDQAYKEVSVKSFKFLLSKTFKRSGIVVISNKGWLQKGEIPGNYGEQPIDVAYTIMALGTFYDNFNEDVYLKKISIAFNWFLGENRLNQIVYNPCTGGCYDGIEESHINLNQGAESTISYLLARLTIGKYYTCNANIKREKKAIAF
ncbi:MAG: glycosyltransferase [Bacteroidales bacterium]|nr:glycosyltransferase [Bacteroidales bacterium]